MMTEIWRWPSVCQGILIYINYIYNYASSLLVRDVEKAENNNQLPDQSP